MNEFEIISPDREDIILTAAIPDKYGNLLLKGADSFMAQCSFGDMLFNHHAGDGFDIWKSNYLIHRDAKVIGRANVPVLELGVMYENSFSIDWKNVTNQRLPPRLIEMYFAPHVENTTQFKGGKQFTTVDFHYHAPLLDQYVKDFKLLGTFMEKVHKGEPAKLFNINQFTCDGIDRIIKEMISYRFRDELAADYYDSYAHILLIHLLERISGFNPNARRYLDSDIQRAKKAHRMLTLEYKKCYTIKQLCRELQTNPYQLKKAFSHLYGTSIGKYKKSVLMDHAKILLEDKKFSIDDISLQLGYSSQQAFSTAFRTHFHVTPTHFRIRR